MNVLLYGMVWFGLVGNGMVVKYEVWAWFGVKWYGRVVRGAAGLQAAAAQFIVYFPAGTTTTN